MLRNAISAGLVAIALCLLSNTAWAAKAIQHTGFGPIQEAMSGVGVAAPLDANAIFINPAGLTEVPNRIDFSIGLGIPISHMNTSATPVGNAAAGNQGNDVEVFPLPFISTAWGFLDDRLIMGLGFVQAGGAAAGYKQSRFNPAITGNNFDTTIDYRIYKFMPAIAYKILDNLSIGATFQVGYATFSTDMLLTATLAQTAGRARTDTAYGFGGSIGLLYMPMPELSLGFGYTSKMKFTKFKKYRDVLSNRSLDAPHQVQAGVAGRPFDWWLIEADFHWLHWNDVTALGASPVNGGLGWRDQYNIGIGTQFTIIDRIKLRLGYSWQTSVVRADTVFVNAIVPLITEMNVNAGVGFDITDNWVVDLAYGMAVQNHKTQRGGDAVSIQGTGTRSEYVGHIGMIGASYKWGK